MPLATRSKRQFFPAVNAARPALEADLTRNQTQRGESWTCGSNQPRRTSVIDAASDSAPQPLRQCFDRLARRPRRRKSGCATVTGPTPAVGQARRSPRTRRRARTSTPNGRGLAPSRQRRSPARARGLVGLRRPGQRRGAPGPRPGLEDPQQAPRGAQPRGVPVGASGWRRAAPGWTGSGRRPAPSARWPPASRRWW